MGFINNYSVGQSPSCHTPMSLHNRRCISDQGPDITVLVFLIVRGEMKSAIFDSKSAVCAPKLN